MKITFQFDIDKAIAAVTFLASHNLPELTVGKVCKLIFLADKYHLVRYARPITGDSFSAMKDGPVPSGLYNIFKEALKDHPHSEEARKLGLAISFDNRYEHPRIGAKSEPDQDQLSASDISALERTIERFGGWTFSQLRAMTHDMVAYERAWSARDRAKKSVPMRFEEFFEDDDDAFIGTKQEMIENHKLNHFFAKF